MVSITGRKKVFINNFRVNFPVDVNQIPDLIIYFADDYTENKRHSYARIKLWCYKFRASKIFVSDLSNINDENTISLKMQEDRSLDLISDDECAGYI